MCGYGLNIPVCASYVVKVPINAVMGYVLIYSSITKTITIDTAIIVTALTPKD